MRRLLIILNIFICNLFFLISYSQVSKRNLNWVVGYWPAVLYNFDVNLKVDTIRPFYISNQPAFACTFGGSNISDLEGNYLLSSNSFIVYNSKGEAIEGFEDMNCISGTKFQQKLGYDGSYNQMSIILPKSNNKYYVFTSGMSDKAFDEVMASGNAEDFRFDNLNYAIVDMDANNGNGKVLEKNKILMQDAYLSHNRMTAVKHANGRDWWLVKPHKTKHLFYSFLVSPDTILPAVESEIIDNLLFTGGVKGQSTFSNNGNLYAYTEYDYKANFYVNYFDRCNGTMTKFRNFTVPNDLVKYNNDFPIGVTFSPNDSLLYVSTLYSIYQIDIYDTSANNYVKIAEPDTLIDYFPNYATLALAPNGKIYIGNKNGTLHSMDFIDKPNIKGLGCNFRGRGNGALNQPFTNLMVPPNMPNYGLGALAGSACDTIRTQPNNWLLYPNPTKENINIKIPNSKANSTVQLIIYNTLGQLIAKNNYNISYEHEAQISIDNLPVGLYILKAKYENEEFISKFVKE